MEGWASSWEGSSVEVEGWEIVDVVPGGWEGEGVGGGCSEERWMRLQYLMRRRKKVSGGWVGIERRKREGRGGGLLFCLFVVFHLEDVNL